MADTVGPSATPIPVGVQTWSSEHLYIHLTGKIEDLKSALGDLRTADHIALNAALTAAKEAVNAALLSVKEANEKNDKEVLAWRENANNWRSAMDDREERFVQKGVHDASIKSLTDTQSELRKMVDEGFKELREFRDRETGRRTAQTAIVAVGLALLTIGLRFI